MKDPVNEAIRLYEEEGWPTAVVIAIFRGASPYQAVKYYLTTRVVWGQ